MPSAVLRLNGKRYVLPTITRMGKRERGLAFSRHSERLGGVHWDRITGSRSRRSDFRACKVQQMRYLSGMEMKPGRARNSSFIRSKCASHLILKRGPMPIWDRVPDRSHFNHCYLPDADVCALLHAHASGIRGRARLHLEEECQTAASCSWHFLFGKGSTSNSSEDMEL